MRRRHFITLLGGAVAWPLAARAQQPAMPVIGFLSSLAQDAAPDLLAAFRRGLGEVGFREGQNVTIEFRFSAGRYDQLPAMAADLVRRPASLIMAQAPPAALAAKAATATVPIVFVVGLDPVAAGLVANFNRPGGNATGISLVTGPLGQKRIELLRELAPKASAIAMLVNPVSPDAAPETRDVEAAAQANNVAVKTFRASTVSEIDAAFASLKLERPEGLLVASDPFYLIRREQIAMRAGELGVPAVYPFREFAISGGLLSYGTSLARAYRQAGIYAGRVLKGDEAAALPVWQPTTFELVLNLKTARALGIDVPAVLHARTDEVIE